jgi:hypothetical protein
LIVTTSDVDEYAFDSGAGTVSFTISVPPNVSNLAPKVAIQDSGGATIAAAGPSAVDFSASVTVNLPAAGSYRLVVASNGGCGNVGHYSISGTIVAPTAGGGSGGTSGIGGSSAGGEGGSSSSGGGAIVLSPSASVAASVAGCYEVDLSWTDVAGEAGFQVLRSSDQVNWTTVKTTASGMTMFADTSVRPGVSYAYVVVTLSGTGASAPSTIVRASTPALPPLPSAVSGLAEIARTASQVVLSWKPGPGAAAAAAAGYVVERSSNGKTWTTVGRVASGTSRFVDTTVGPLKTYFYRVRATNLRGVSAPSRVVKLTTPRAPLAHPARKKAR